MERTPSGNCFLVGPGFKHHGRNSRVVVVFQLPDGRFGYRAGHENAPEAFELEEQALLAAEVAVGLVKERI